MYPESPTTVSLGVAQGPRPGKPPNALLLAADAALYRAKEAGCDRVAPHEGPGCRRPPGGPESWPAVRVSPCSP